MEPTQIQTPPREFVGIAPSYGPSVREPQETIQIRNPRAAEGTSAATGPFCKVTQVDDEWILLGGTVTGGDGNEVIADIVIGTVGSEPADGTFFYFRANYTANEEDGLTMPNGNLTSIVTPTSGTSIPDNQMPTIADPDGYIYIPLGQWSGGTFNPAACGNIFVTHTCIGNLTHSR